MASLTPKDVHALMNLLVKEATGQEDLDVVDTSSFVDAGQKVLATGYENTLNALSMVLGRTLIAVRPYKARYSTIQAMNSGEYTHRLRKISYYAKTALPAGNFNTQLYPENLFQGNTNAQVTTQSHEATKSMWLQNQPVPFELNFAGSDVWQDSITVYDYQIKAAFRSEEEFAKFAAGFMTEKGNDIESQKEAFNRMAVLNKIADVYQTGNTEQVVNLTYGFNQKFGTNYTSAQLRTTYLKEFLQYFVSVFKLTSDRLTERSALYHKAFAKTVKNAETGSNETLMIMRHTPKADQHALLYNPLFIDAQAQVMPSIFNPEYLRIENYEPVDFWQSNYSEALRPQINVYPAIYDDTTGTTIKGDQVQIPYVVGMLFDRDALVTDFQIDRTDSTPLEARKHYRTVWFSYSKMVYSDPSENCVIFTMEDPSEGAAVVGSAVVGTDVAG